MELKYLVIHCTDTPEGRNVTKQDIERWHLSPKPRGREWSRTGYSDLLEIDGKLTNLRPFDQDDIVQSIERTWGVYGVNSCSRHMVYAGGRDRNGNYADTRNDAQLEAMRIYVEYMILRHPDIKVAGHNQFADKACPSFDVPKWAKSIGLKSKNIYTKK